MSDGRAWGTRRIADLRAGPESSDPRLLTRVNDLLFFVVSNKYGKELWALPLERESSEPRFIRGKASAEDVSPTLEVADAVNLLRYLFLGEFIPPCLESIDVDDSGSIDVADAIRLLVYLFLSGPAPAGPFPSCGQDPTPAGLSCESFPLCAL